MVQTDALIILSTALDRMRETQLRHGLILAKIEVHLSGNSTRSKMWPILLQQIAANGGKWAAGLLAMAYVAKGGDIMTGLQTLLRFYG